MSRHSQHAVATGFDAPQAEVPSLIDRIKIYEPNGDRLPYDSVKFRAVTAVINLGLSMLETQIGRNRLKDIAVKVIGRRDRLDHIYEGSLDDLLPWVGLFLRRLRTRFIHVYLEEGYAEEGSVIKANWAAGGKTMKDWHPASSGKMCLNNKLTGDLITAGWNSNSSNEDQKRTELAAYESMMFLMGVTIAHELKHLWVGFLTGDVTPNTPPEVSYCPKLYTRKVKGRMTGESGRHFEGLVFGGTIEAFEDASHPLGTRQFRTLYLVDNMGMARRIDHACVQRNLELNFDFPFKTTGTSVSLDKIRSENRHMQVARLNSGARSARAAQPDGRHRDFVNNRQSDSIPADTVKGRPFQMVCAIPRNPKLLFVSY